MWKSKSIFLMLCLVLETILVIKNQKKKKKKQKQFHEAMFISKKYERKYQGKKIKKKNRIK